MTSTGPERSRVAELIVTRGTARSRGSGYRITSTAVLTAAHVVADADSVRVRFNPDLPDEWCVTAGECSLDATSDIAVLSISAPDGESPLERAGFGQVMPRLSVVAAQAVGFPLWKLRDTGNASYRDACHAVGSVAVLSNWRSGTLEFTLNSAPAARHDDRSPWQGMSGAALWMADRIVGVVAEHHPGDGLGRLTVARIDRTKLIDGDLPVVPAPAGEPTATAYREQLVDIAPDYLHDRQDELDELTRFCAGTAPYLWWQAGPWAGKSALLSWFALHPPYGVDVVSFFITSRLSGQSDSDAYTNALLEQLAVLVGEDPRDTLAATSRHGHVLRLLKAAAEKSEQAGRRLLLVVDGLDEDTGRPTIAALLPRRPPPGARILLASRPHPPIPPDVPVDHPLRTLEPRRLSASPYAHDLEINATYELQRLLNGPPAQRDVLGLLTASGGGLTASDLEELIGQPPYELAGLLAGVLGRTIGSRNSRSFADSRPQPAYLFAHETLRVTAEQQFGGSIARYRDQLHGWAETYRSGGWGPDTPVYLMRGYPRMLSTIGDLPRLLGCVTDSRWHDRVLDVTGGDTLALAEVAFARSLAKQRGELGALVLLAVAEDRLTDRNNVPSALPALWARLGRPERAITIAADVEPRETRVIGLCRLATTFAAQHDLPRARRMATAAAAAMPDNASDALRVPLSGALAAIGAHDEAVETASAIADPERKGDALVALALAFLADRHEDRALRTGILAINAVTAAGVAIRASVLFRLVPVFLAAGAAQRELLVSMVDSVLVGVDDGTVVIDTLLARGRIAAVLAMTGNVDKATELFKPTSAASEVPHSQLGDLAMLAVDLGAAGLRDQATRVAVEIADVIASRKPDEWWYLYPVSASRPEFIRLFTDAGEFDRAERFARRARRSDDRARALRALAQGMSAAGLDDRATALLAAEEATAHAIDDDRSRAIALLRLAVEIATLGDIDRAARLAETASRAAGVFPSRSFDDWEWEGASALIRLAGVMADAGDVDRAVRFAMAAEQEARRVPNRVARFPEVLSRLALTLAKAQDSDRAERLALCVNAPKVRANTLLGLVRSAVTVGDLDRVRQLVPAVEAAAREVPDADGRRELLDQLVLLTTPARERDDDSIAGATVPLRALIRALIRVQDFDHVAAIQGDITDDQSLAAVLDHVRARAGDDAVERIAAVAAAQPKPRLRVYVLAEAAAAVSAVGDHDRAVELARLAREQIEDRDPPSPAVVVTIGSVYAAAGDPTRAEDLPSACYAAAAANRVWCAAGLAEMFLARGDQERGAALLAATEAAVVRNLKWESKNYRAMMAAVVAAGDFDAAERLAGRITGDRHMTPSLVHLAAALAVAGRRGRAERVVRSITNADDRVTALGELLAVFADAPAGDPADPGTPVRDLIVEVLGTPAWDDALPLLGQFSLPALQHAADVLIGKTALSFVPPASL